MTDQPKVMVVSLGRANARGERRRVASWVAMFRGAGCVVDEVSLLDECPRRLPPSPRQVLDVLRGAAVAEMLTWSPRALQRRIDSSRPDLVVCVTARAYHPRLSDRPVLLDFVDRLSLNYHARARLATPCRRPIFRALAWSNRRFEQTSHRTCATTAAGAVDATALGAAHVPIVVPLPTTDGAHRAPDADLLFTGSLAYSPNVEALRAIADAWPEVQARRPGTTLVVAGATPNAAVTKMTSRFGWELVADFPSVAAMHRRAKIAVAPLRTATGIQTKVLDAACYGVPQVVSPAAANGLPPGFPGIIASDDSFVDEVLELLDDDARRSTIAEEAQQWVADTCGLAQWSRWAEQLMVTLGATAR